MVDSAGGVLAVSASATPEAFLRKFTYDGALSPAWGPVRLGEQLLSQPSVSTTDACWIAADDVGTRSLLETSAAGASGASIDLASANASVAAVLSDGDLVLSAGSYLRRFSPTGTARWTPAAPQLGGVGLAPLVLDDVVANFITDAPGERGYTNTLTLSGGTYSDYRVDDAFSWRGEKGGVSVAGGYRTYDGFDLEACSDADAAAGTCKKNPQTIGQPPSTYWNASGTADFEITKKVVARFFGDYQLREVRDYYFSGATQLASSVYDSQRDLTRYTLSPEVDFLLSPRTSFNVTYTFGKYLRDETRVYDPAARPTVLPCSTWPECPQPPWREWNRQRKFAGR